MKALSVASIIEKNKLASDTPFLLLLDIEVVNPDTRVVEEVVHYVNNTETVSFNGNVYDPASFELDFKQEAGAPAQVTVKIKDFTRQLQARMQEYGGGIGFNVTMIVLNAGNLTQPPEVIEYFQVTNANVDQYIVTFMLGVENALNFTFPRRRQLRDFCSWRYKDADTCKYSGALPTCDLTLQGPNGCAAHNNSVNFGGFPGINSNNARYA